MGLIRVVALPTPAQLERLARHDMIRGSPDVKPSKAELAQLAQLVEKDLSRRRVSPMGAGRLSS